VRGGAGNDTINGGEGNDLLRGRRGDDTVSGGPGNDRVFVGPGADTEFGGPGNDRMHAVFPDNQVDTIDCGAGYDIVFLNKNEHDLTDDCEVIRYVTPRWSANESADTDDR
jgi:Ca2+-binding RTX toxin-like protein